MSSTLSHPAYVKDRFYLPVPEGLYEADITRTRHGPSRLITMHFLDLVFVDAFMMIYQFLRLTIIHGSINAFRNF